MKYATIITIMAIMAFFESNLAFGRPYFTQNAANRTPISRIFRQTSPFTWGKKHATQSRANRLVVVSASFPCPPCEKVKKAVQKLKKEGYNIKIVVDKYGDKVYNRFPTLLYFDRLMLIEEVQRPETYEQIKAKMVK